MSQIKYFIGFNLIKGIGCNNFSKLENHFPSIEDAWRAGRSELAQAGIDDKTIESIVTGRPHIDLDEESGKLERLGIKAISWNDPDYPPYLRLLTDCPPLLYIKGSLMPRDLHSIAVVGSRRATVYGKQITHRITEELIYNDITVVSGLARGIDTVAHSTAVKSNGRTIAVMGCGLDMVYPPENADLARDIVENGAILSEFAVGTKPLSYNFPRRNRIISALSMGVLVVEAAEKSGALITAERALEQNKEVFAIPGNVMSPLSAGTNRLIQQGAKLVIGVNDILDEFGIVSKDKSDESTYEASGIEVSILKQMSYMPIHVDEICRNSGLDIATVSSSLMLLELNGVVQQAGGMQYMLSNRMTITQS